MTARRILKLIKHVVDSLCIPSDDIMVWNRNLPGTEYRNTLSVAKPSGSVSEILGSHETQDHAFQFVTTGNRPRSGLSRQKSTGIQTCAC